MRGLANGVLVAISWASASTGARCLDARMAAWIDDPAAPLPSGCLTVQPPRFTDAP